MPQETKTFETQQSLAERSLQGLAATREDEAALADALEKAFDYRGDVTLTLAGGRVVTGYIFDRRRGAGLADSTVRLLPADSDEKMTARFSEIERVEFTGRDMAHGKSFETWVQKFTQKRLSGERASIESETL